MAPSGRGREATRSLRRSPGDEIAARAQAQADQWLSLLKQRETESTVGDHYDLGRGQVMNRFSSISLLEIEPDLAGVLSDEQRAEAELFLLPTAAVDKGGDVSGVLEDSGAFGAIVLEGLLVQAMQISEDPTLTLIAPGSFVPPSLSPCSMSIAEVSLFVPVTTRLVLLGEELLVAAGRWPWIVSSLHARALEHSERLATQLAICQLPRVEDRLMAVMWLLAEFWGRVTPGGIRLPVSLSHEVLGGLIGARRPTVTLALRKLAERGALIGKDAEWLIVEPPRSPVLAEPKGPQLLRTARPRGVWVAQPPAERGPEELRVLVQQLAQAREESARRRLYARELAERARSLLERTRRLMSQPGQTL